MIPASVGFQCPDDVREGAASMRAATPRTVTGARMSARPGSITIGLIVLNVIAYALQQTGGNEFTGKYLLWDLGVQQGEYYRLLSAAFLHGSITHLLVNMFSLYFLGTQVERYLGTTRFLAVYFLSALGGTTASLIASTTPSLGASGAVFGLLGALLLIVRRLKFDASQLLGMLGINLAIGFFVPNIDWRAHLGGLIVGAALTYAFTFAPKETRRWVHPAAVVAVLALLTTLVLARVAAKEPLIGGTPEERRVRISAVLDPQLPQRVHDVAHVSAESSLR